MLYINILKIIKNSFSKEYIKNGIFQFYSGLIRPNKFNPSSAKHNKKSLNYVNKQPEDSCSDPFIPKHKCFFWPDGEGNYSAFVATHNDLHPVYYGKQAWVLVTNISSSDIIKVSPVLSLSIEQGSLLHTNILWQLQLSGQMLIIDNRLPLVYGFPVSNTILIKNKTNNNFFTKDFTEFSYQKNWENKLFTEKIMSSQSLIYKTGLIPSRKYLEKTCFNKEMLENITTNLYSSPFWTIQQHQNFKKVVKSSVVKDRKFFNQNECDTFRDEANLLGTESDLSSILKKLYDSISWSSV